MKYAFTPIALLYLIVIMSLNARAQTGRLSGIVTNPAHTPLESASVTITLLNDSTMRRTVLTNAAGRFLCTTPHGRYSLHITAIGYYDTTIQVSLQHLHDSIVIMLRDHAAALATVSVTSKKMLIERKAGKTTLNIDGSILSAGSNVLEILEQAPGVKIDNGNILLKGTPGVTVFIDDKPTYLQQADLADYLRVLPAALLDKIEIMSNPSAQYDAAGTGGIINIKLKKGKVKGVNGNILAEHTQGKYGRTSQSINLNIRRNKFNTYLNLSNYNGTGFSDIHTERNYTTTNDNTMSLFNQQTFSTIHNDRVLAKAGIDYFASAKAVYGGAFSYMNNGRRVTQNLHSVQTYKYTGDSALNGNNLSSGTTTNIITNLYYKYVYDSLGKELLLDADYIRYQSTNQFQNKSAIAALNTSSPANELFSGSVPAVINIYTIKADYNYPFSNHAKLSVGYKFSAAHTDNNASYTLYKDAGISPIYQSVNHFKYKENIHAAYASFSMENKYFTAQLGLRAEYMRNRGETVNDSVFTTNYIRLFPTFFFGYKLDKQSYHLVHFSYGRRIERPGYTDLNPFPVPVNRYTFRVGNPFLQPQLSDNIELSYLFKSTLSVSVFYNNLRNGIDETYTTQGNVFNYVMSNINSKKIYSASLDASWNLLNNWTINPVIIFTHITSNAMLNGASSYNSGNNVDLSFNQQCSFKHGWNAEMNAGYSTKQVYPQYEQAPTWYIHAGVSKKMGKDKWVLKLNFRDIFYTRVDKQQYTNMNTLSGYMLRQWDTRNVTLAIGYRFSKGQKAAQVKRGTASGEENNRLKE